LGIHSKRKEHALKSVRLVNVGGKGGGVSKSEAKRSGENTINLGKWRKEQGKKLAINKDLTLTLE
jgi:hypothetical protein